jgi:hypothetical protein
VLKQQAMPVLAVIVPVCTMGMAREGTCPKKGGRNGASLLERWSGREVAKCDSCAAEEGAAVDDVMGGRRKFCVNFVEES